MAGIINHCCCCVPGCALNRKGLGVRTVFNAWVVHILGVDCVLPQQRAQLNHDLCGRHEGGWWLLSGFVPCFAPISCSSTSRTWWCAMFMTASLSKKPFQCAPRCCMSASSPSITLIRSATRFCTCRRAVKHADQCVPAALAGGAASRPHLAQIELCGACAEAQLRYRRIHSSVLCCCCRHLDLIYACCCCRSHCTCLLNVSTANEGP